MHSKISLIVPFYNEEASVDSFFSKVIPILVSTNRQYEIVCVNDGSKDDTLQKLIDQKSLCPQIVIVDFSRNFGKEAALAAGLDFATGDCVIPIDCDLQDPPELIIDMLKKWDDGFDVVLARRCNRSTDGIIKRGTSSCFYKISKFIMSIDMPENVGDFRLLDRKVVDELKKFTERTRFMKGLFAYAGFRSAYIDYSRPERAQGTTKWNYWKLWNYAIDGITSFSTVPLRMMSYLGLLITFFSFLFGLRIIINILIQGIDVPGYASTIVAVLFLGGVQLIGLGIIGEYIGRIYIETKKRPIYIVRSVL